MVDITRYVDGTLAVRILPLSEPYHCLDMISWNLLQLLSGLKLVKMQRTASGRDLAKSKVERTQHTVHVSVNLLLKKLLKIKNQVPALRSKNLPRFYQVFFAIRNVR